MQIKNEKSYTHTRARVPIIYIIIKRLFPLLKRPTNPQKYVLKQKILKIAKNTTIDYQALTKKMHFLCNFFSKIFGQFKNLLYLCIRFRSKTGNSQEREQ